MAKKTENVSNMRQRTHKGVDSIMDRAERMRKSGKETMTRLKEKATMARGNVDGYIQKRPERSVLVAAGFGMALGTILTATLMRQKHKGINRV